MRVGDSSWQVIQAAVIVELSRGRVGDWETITRGSGNDLQVLATPLVRRAREHPRTGRAATADSGSHPGECTIGDGATVRQQVSSGEARSDLVAVRAEVRHGPCAQRLRRPGFFHPTRHGEAGCRY